MSLQQTIQNARRAIRPFIQTFSDQRLAEVYAFNADGKMKWTDPCGCIIGVAGASYLHNGQQDCPDHHRHYLPVKFGADYHQDASIEELDALPLPKTAEWGYLNLGSYSVARLRLSAILRAEMRRRSRIRQAEQQLQAVQACHR